MNMHLLSHTFFRAPFKKNYICRLNNKTWLSFNICEKEIGFFIHDLTLKLYQFTMNIYCIYTLFIVSLVSTLLITN